MMSDLVTKIGMGMSNLERERPRSHYELAEYAIATVLREMYQAPGNTFSVHYFIERFAAEHNIALDPIGEGKKMGGKDGL